MYQQLKLERCLKEGNDNRTQVNEREKLAKAHTIANPSTHVGVNGINCLLLIRLYIKIYVYMYGDMKDYGESSFRLCLVQFSLATKKFIPRA